MKNNEKDKNYNLDYTNSNNKDTYNKNNDYTNPNEHEYFDFEVNKAKDVEREYFDESSKSVNDYNYTNTNDYQNTNKVNNGFKSTNNSEPNYNEPNKYENRDYKEDNKSFNISKPKDAVRGSVSKVKEVYEDKNIKEIIEKNINQGQSNQNKNMNIRLIYGLYGFIFAILVIYLVNFFMFKSEEISNSPLNPRAKAVDKSVERGDFITQDGVTLTDRDGEKPYIYGRTYSNILGYIGDSVMGLEASYALELNKIDFEFIQRVSEIFTKKKPKGNGVKLNINSEYQELARELISDQKGSIIVLEPNTGAILAMVSNPSFNPNTIDEYYEELRNDEDSPLINRGSQGLYPPGSTFKAISALAFMRNDENYADYVYDCDGEYSDGKKVIKCHNNEVHGKVNLKDALTVSCNGYFSSLSEKVTPEQLTKTANDIMFNTQIAGDFSITQSKFDVPGDEYVQTLIGQGNTLMTPLHLGLFYSAIANGGNINKPYLADEIVNAKGKARHDFGTDKLRQIMTEEEVRVLSESLSDVAEDGTAKSLSDLPFEIVSKTGTAQTDSGKDHGWFVGYAPRENPQAVVVFMYENNGGSKAVVGDAKQMFKKVINDKKEVEENN